MVLHIGCAIRELLDTHTRHEIADTIGVSPGLISTWLQKNNDFCPRVKVAANIYKHYNLVVFPYSEDALQHVNKD